MTGIKNHRKLLPSMNSAPSNCLVCKVSWKMVNLIPRSLFPVPCSPFPFLKIADKAISPILVPHSPFPVPLFKGSLFKEINRLIRKGMYILLFDIFNWCSLFSSIKERFVKHLLLRKTDVLKTSILSERKFEEMHFLGRAKRYIRGNVYFGIIFSCLSSIKPCLRFLLICFDWAIKDLYQSSLGNEIDFADIMNVSPNILAKN